MLGNAGSPASLRLTAGQHRLCYPSDERDPDWLGAKKGTGLGDWATSRPKAGSPVGGRRQASLVKDWAHFLALRFSGDQAPKGLGGRKHSCLAQLG